MNIKYKNYSKESILFLLDWLIFLDTGNTFGGSLLCFLLLDSDSLIFSQCLLLSELLLTNFLILDFVNSLDENGLIFVLITLGGEIEIVVHMLIDFLGFSIFLKKSSQYSLSPHPQYFLWHSRF